jgi:hypothetical protein
VPSTYLPTLYKARGMPLKQPACAICIDRTRGRTQAVRMGYGVVVHLCAGHASAEFQRSRGGRDFVRTLMGVWEAAGCLTRARHRALDAHLAAQREHPARPRPGSYAWPDLRRALERRFAGGVRPFEAARSVRHRYAECPARPPSRRTLERWHHQRRWLTSAPHAPPA